jgi:hypothetical protein
MLRIAQKAGGVVALAVLLMVMQAGRAQSDQKPAEKQSPTIPELIQLLKDAAMGQDEAKVEALRKQIEEAVRKRAEGIGKRLPGGVRNLVPSPEESRLGARLEAPGEALVNQLGLPKGQGLVVGQVAADSAAAKAGVQTHDILLELAGKPVSSDPAQFAKAVAEIKANEPVSAVVLRKGQKTTVKGLALPAAPAAAPTGPFGNLFRLAPPGSVPGPDGKGSSWVARRDDGFSAFHRCEDGIMVLVRADLVMDKLEDDEIDITITDGKSKDDYKVNEVPPKYQAIVKHLLDLGLKAKPRIDKPD